MTVFQRNANNRIRLLMLFVVMAIITLFSVNNYAQQLDETRTVAVNGQSVQVNPDGSFKISNISAADLFGVGGPGSIADFVSDDFLRAVATRTFNGITQYAFSEPFQITNGETFVIGPMTFTDFPPPFPDSLTIQVAEPVLTGIGQTAQLIVTGIIADGGAIDVTLRSHWTIYRTSNPNIATVGPDGLVTAQGEGIAFITAVNEGATAVKRITVVPGDPLTTVEGFVLLEDGTPVDGADVNIQPVDISATTNIDGLFQITDGPTEFGPLFVRASKSISNERFVGVKGMKTFEKGGVTDAGIVTLSLSVPKTLYSISPEDEELRVIDPSDASTISSVEIDIVGKAVDGGVGLATHPLTGELWALLKCGGCRRSRELAVIDPSTGVGTSVGNTGDAFAGLAFDSAGTLYGVTGDGAGTPETLFTISTIDAVPTLLLELGNGEAGETIAFNPVDGFMYHASGHYGNDDVFFESIDLNSLSITDIPIVDTLLIEEETQALTYWEDENVFLWKQDHDEGPLFRVTSNGIETYIGEMDHQSKGLAFVPTP